jgi:dTDP-4-amino-4,6-dideoxygalactose transaminase
VRFGLIKNLVLFHFSLALQYLCTEIYYYMNDRIFLSFPHPSGSEMKWINEAFKNNWIVPLGPNVDLFEELLGKYLEGTNVVALSAGTAAIHLGLVMLDVQAGDEVVCQSFTFSASANPVKYQGASPVFVDSEPDSWNMDPVVLEETIVDRKRITGKYPKAIVVVHLYGMPAKMNEILAVGKKYNIPVLEDAAEALGSTYFGHKCGTFGEYGALSFNGNKVITTSGGGALICPSPEAAKRVKFLATQAREAKPYYYHTVVGYNYRLSNVSAGIGIGQMDVLDAHLARRRAIHALYTEGFKDFDGVTVKQDYSAEVDSNFWLSTILFDKDLHISPEDARQALEAQNIESRWIWRPMNMMPLYKDAPYYGGTVAEDIFNRGLCLPSGSVLTDNDVQRVIETVKNFVKSR